MREVPSSESSFSPDEEVKFADSDNNKYLSKKELEEKFKSPETMQLANKVVRSFKNIDMQTREDIRQQAYIRAIEAVEKGCSVQKFEPWFRRVIVTTMLNRTKSDGRKTSKERHGSDGNLVELLPDKKTNASELLENRQIVMKCIDSLDDNAREIMILAAQGYTPTETSDILNIEIKKIWDIKHRATKKLKKMLIEKGVLEEKSFKKAA